MAVSGGRSAPFVAHGSGRMRLERTRFGFAALATPAASSSFGFFLAFLQLKGFTPRWLRA